MTPYIIIKQAGFDCPFCDAAEALLKTHGQTYQLRVLARDALLAEAKTAAMTTVPIIYHGAQLIGGLTELEANFHTS